jgi:hypothetical protein
VHRRVALAVAGLTAIALVVAAVVAWRAVTRSDFERAVAMLPGETLRATWTDWAQVRALADGEDLGPGQRSRVEDFLERGFEQDLTGTSALPESTYAMAELYGVSPLDAEWEIYGQSREGAAALLQVGEGVDLGQVERNLRELGYEPPQDGAGSGGVWAGSPDLVAQIDSTLTPVLQNVVVLPDERIVLLSDEAGYASSAANVVRGDAGGLADETSGVDALAGLPEQPVTSVIFAADFACEAVGMAAADAEDQRLADQLVARAGGVSPLFGLVMAVERDGRLVVGMHYESAEQAEADLQARVDLASGDAPGQGGTFGERFRITSAEQRGELVEMVLVPAADEPALLSDLTQGPLLFAAC